MMRAIPQVDLQMEIQRAACAQKDGGYIRLQARPVRGDQDIRSQRLPLCLEEVGKSGRASFFGHFNHPLGVET